MKPQGTDDKSDLGTVRASGSGTTKPPPPVVLVDAFLRAHTESSACQIKHHAAAMKPLHAPARERASYTGTGYRPVGRPEPT